MMPSLLLVCACSLLADGGGVIASKHADRDFALTADPNSASWKRIRGVFAENGPKGEPVPNHRTEIRSQWTDRNLYFLFICPYETLNLKPDPTPSDETNKLWNWDVAEVFIGTDFDHIRQYKEFQV